jgi:hypothetical protein
LACHDGAAAAGDVGWFNANGPHVEGDAQVPAGANRIGAAGDLANNHPVAMPFPLAGVASTYNGESNGAAAALSDWTNPVPTSIRLYTDTSGVITAGATSGSTGIECSSCHDPHNGADATGPFFLRGLLGGNTADYICAKCHDR